MQRTYYTSKDEESDLGDYGVRKYDDLTGRFTATDPLWEKYYGWSPYVYSANNPVNRVDRDGRKIIPINLNEMELKANEKKMQIAKEVFANSPTVMNIIKTAEGENTMIHIYSYNDNIKEDLISQNFPGGNITKALKNANGNSSAVTFATGDKFIKSDIVFKSNSFGYESIENEYIQPYTIVEFLDELMHSTQPKGQKQEIEHYNFYNSLIKEIDSGVLKLNLEYESTIRTIYKSHINK